MIVKSVELVASVWILLLLEEVAVEVEDDVLAESEDRLDPFTNSATTFEYLL